MVGYSADLTFSLEGLRPVGKPRDDLAAGRERRTSIRRGAPSIPSGILPKVP